MDFFLNRLIEKHILDAKGYLLRNPPLPEDPDLRKRVNELRKKIPAFDLSCDQVILVGGAVPFLMGKEYAQKILKNLGIEEEGIFEAFERTPSDYDIRFYLKEKGRSALENGQIHVVKTLKGKDPRPDHIFAKEVFKKIHLDDNYSVVALKDWEFILVNSLPRECLFSHTNLRLDLENATVDSFEENPHQALLDLMTKVIHAKNPDTIDPKGWARLMIDYTKGFRCLEKGLEEILFEKSDREKLIKYEREHLKNPGFAFAVNVGIRHPPSFEGLIKDKELPKTIITEGETSVTDCALFVFLSYTLSKDGKTRLIRHQEGHFLQYSQSETFQNDCILLPPFDLEWAKNSKARFEFKKINLLPEEALREALGDLQAVKDFVKEKKNCELAFYFQVMLFSLGEESCETLFDTFLPLFKKNRFLANCLAPFFPIPLAEESSPPMHWVEPLETLLKEIPRSAANFSIIQKLAAELKKCEKRKKELKEIEDLLREIQGPKPKKTVEVFLVPAPPPPPPKMKKKKPTQPKEDPPPPAPKPPPKIYITPPKKELEPKELIARRSKMECYEPELADPIISSVEALIKRKPKDPSVPLIQETLRVKFPKNAKKPLSLDEILSLKDPLNKIGEFHKLVDEMLAKQNFGELVAFSLSLFLSPFSCKQKLFSDYLEKLIDYCWLHHQNKEDFLFDGKDLLEYTLKTTQAACSRGIFESGFKEFLEKILLPIYLYLKKFSIKHKKKELYDHYYHLFFDICKKDYSDFFEEEKREVTLLLSKS